MTNLTEYSWYYCKMNDGDIRMLERGADYFLDGDVPLLNNEVKSVLAEVPSYELWKAKLEENANLQAELKKVCIRTIDFNIYNSQLKGLLKEVLRHELSLKEVTELTRKISEVLGEE